MIKESPRINIETREHVTPHDALACIVEAFKTSCFSTKDTHTYTYISHEPHKMRKADKSP